ncbi:competence protein ComJ [Paenibacillus chartarius]|uniref:Competence protein ComJ n=1 Tax=Paenibacillus chartarius TaxID=747481 RepID=A0ABV6DQ59_9BACL
MTQHWPLQQIFVSYSQIAVFRKQLPHPFSDWSDAHIAQGFAWREGSVSFGTPSEADDQSEIDVSVQSELHLQDNAVRAIVVPFVVGPEGVTVSSIMSAQHHFDVPPGTYELLFEAIPQFPGHSDPMKVRYAFRFVPHSDPQPRVLKHDDELAPPPVLLMEAKAAV